MYFSPFSDCTLFRRLYSSTRLYLITGAQRRFEWTLQGVSGNTGENCRISPFWCFVKRKFCIACIWFWMTRYILFLQFWKQNKSHKYSYSWILNLHNWIWVCPGLSRFVHFSHTPLIWFLKRIFKNCLYLNRYFFEKVFYLDDLDTFWKL